MLSSSPVPTLENTDEIIIEGSGNYSYRPVVIICCPSPILLFWREVEGGVRERVDGKRNAGLYTVRPVAVLWLHHGGSRPQVRAAAKEG